jgi:hypothetical protein
MVVLSLSWKNKRRRRRKEKLFAPCPLNLTVARDYFIHKLTLKLNEIKLKKTN